MAESVLQLNNVTKTYVLGKRKNAQKAQKAIHKLQKKYEKLAAKGNSELTKQIRKKLNQAQTFFAADKFEASYHVATGKTLKKRRRDRGDVVHALNNVSLAIQKGELVAIMGPSGSGKSTLVNMLGLLDEPTAGEIYLQGRGVTSIRRHELPEIRSRELGFVFQSFNLIPTLTALENVMLPLKYAGIHLRRRKDIARKALERVGLGDRLNHDANELSGGQRQRVAIARSIVNNPAIVFGDELTGELDSKMTQEVMKLVLSLNKKGQTFIIVTHNPDVAKHAKRIIYMRDGRIEKETQH
ncbi:ABC transporter ATP-binding protein [Candidatus Saccharibacteria bacterium]|nr:ABC transporter ATP-binding protein [Candidatus Saccharibacteria bacterium]